MSLQPINSPTTWKRAQTSINANFTALVNALAGPGTVDATDPVVTALLTDNGSGAYTAVEGIVEDVADAVVEGLITASSDTRTALDGRYLNRDNAPINLRARGARGGAGEQTTILQAAVDDAISTGRPLEIPADPAGAYLTGTITVDGSLRVIGDGALTMNPSSALDRLFNITATDGADVRIEGVRVVGDSFEAIRVDSDAEIGSLSVRNVVTERHGIRVTGAVSNRISIRDTLLGSAVTSAYSGTNPDVAIAPPTSSDAPEQVELVGVTIRQGSDSTRDCFAISNMATTTTTVIDRCAAIDLSPDTGNFRDGFDLDGVGRFLRMSNCVMVGTMFEYKPGASYDRARDAVMTNLVSINSKSVGFSLRSSVEATNLIAYNPNSWSFYVTAIGASDVELSDIDVRLRNLVAINNGATGFRGMRVGLPATIDGYTCRPEYGTSHASTNAFQVSEAISGKFRDVTVHNAAGVGIEVLPLSGTAGTLVFEDPVVDGTTGAAFAMRNAEAVHLIRPNFTNFGTSRVQYASDIPFVEVQADEAQNYINYGGAARATVMRVNGMTVYTRGTGGGPPPVTGHAAVGTLAVNAADNTLWLRVSASSTPATAWKKVTVAS